MYLLDSNTLVEAKNKYYKMTVCEGFWRWLEINFQSGNIGSIQPVWEEVSKGTDDLARWTKFHKPYFEDISNPQIQNVATQISKYITSNQVYKNPFIDRFLSEADLFLIAKAKVINGTVVTLEEIVPPNSSKVKIQNMYNVFGVAYCHTFELLERFGAKFKL